jgi:transglutaminase-like putative cysteine protease
MIAIRTLLDGFTYAACLFGVLPLYAYLELPAQVAFPAAMVTGLVCDRRQRYLCGRITATLLSVFVFAFYGLRLNLTHVVEPAVNLLVLLLAIRLITEKQPRNYLQIFVLAIFALAGSSLLTLSPLFFPVLVLLVVSATLGLIFLTFHASDPQLCLPTGSLRPLFTVSLMLPVGSLLLMMVFFGILPRTQYPLWNFLNPGSSAKSGFSEHVRPGVFARNAASRALVFRVESEPLGLEDLYWRGIVLNVVEGGSWRRRTPPEQEGLRLSGGRPLTQIIYPEARTDGFLFTLDPTEQVGGAWVRSSADLVHVQRTSRKHRVSYQSVARLGASRIAQRADHDFYLQLPPSISQRLRDTAAALVTPSDSAADKIARTEAFFRRQQLVYATSDLPGPERPLEEFLFDKKRGYCEFFASSFALLLRLEGVPARLVGGYHGGNRNELAGYYSITEDMAHVWVEALVDNVWRRIDPSHLAVNANSASLVGRGSAPDWHRRLLDAADYYWTRVVISYDLAKQLELAKGAGFTLRGVSAVSSMFRLAGALLVVVAGLLVVIWLQRRLTVSVEKRLVQNFLRLIEVRFGMKNVPSNLGLKTLADQTGDARCKEFAAIYSAAIYRDRVLQPSERARLQCLLRSLRKF